MDYKGALVVGCVGQLIMNKTELEMDLVSEQFCMLLLTGHNVLWGR